jgi:hypothetical protein
MQRIHIVGVSPRTGTTLLAECMVACFEIDAYEEHECPLSTHRTDAIYLTKKPSDLHIVRPRLFVDRRFHVIAMLRDPRDIIVSKHDYEPESYWTTLRVWKQRLPVLKRLMSHQRCIVVRYENLVRRPDEVQGMLVQRMPFLKPKARFSAFHTCAMPSEKSLDAMGPLRKITTDSIGKWRNHLARVAGQMQIHGTISGDLIDLGYEPDDSWMSALVDRI